MNGFRHPKRRRSTGTPRRGLAAIEVTMTLAVAFTFAVAMYSLAEFSLRNLFHVIGNLVGWPYL